jgi:putative FmdB family regulatory protein
MRFRSFEEVSTSNMPTYVYGCDACGHRFEIFQKFSDQPLTACPQCGAPIRRIFQPAGIVFKGSGWYSTDSRSGGSARSSDASSNGDTANKDDKKSTETTANEGASTEGAAKPAPKPASEAATP